MGLVVHALGMEKDFVVNSIQNSGYCLCHICWHLKNFVFSESLNLPPPFSE